MSDATVRMPRCNRLIILALTGAMAASGGAVDLLAQDAIQESFDMRVPVSPSPVVISGAPHLVYELHLTNFAPDPLVVREVEIVEVGTGSLLSSVHGEELADRLARPGASSTGQDVREVPPGGHAVLYLELRKDDGRVPAGLEHRLLYDRRDADHGPPAAVTGASIAVDAEGPAILGPPLREGPWVAAYHPSWERGHRRVFYAVDGRARIPGRFAVDWIRLDESGQWARGDDDIVGNWHGHGADVLAVADAVVAAARDDVPEHPTISGNPRLPLKDGAGNYLTLDLGDGRYVSYEHLSPGSIRVGVGDRVRRGQVIGAVGFTGHSMGPHLHLHVADANATLDAEGLPFALEEFNVLGAYDDLSSVGHRAWLPADDGEQSWRTGEFPAPLTVMEFRPAPPHQ